MNRFSLNLTILIGTIFSFVHVFSATRVEKIIPSFKNNEIVMVAPTESCGGVIIQQPTQAIENWDYKNDILELKSWRHFLGNNDQEERVPLNNAIEIKYDSPEEIKKNPEKLKTFYVMYDSSGTTISDYYSISCAKLSTINGVKQEPVLVDCAGVVSLSGFQESDKYLRCNSQVGPLAGYSFRPFNLNVVQPLETAPETTGTTSIYKSSGSAPQRIGTSLYVPSR